MSNTCIVRTLKVKGNFFKKNHNCHICKNLPRVERRRGRYTCKQNGD